MINRLIKISDVNNTLDFSIFYNFSHLCITLFQPRVKLGCNDGPGFVYDPKNETMYYYCHMVYLQGFCTKDWFHSVCRKTCGRCGMYIISISEHMQNMIKTLGNDSLLY